MGIITHTGHATMGIITHRGYATMGIITHGGHAIMSIITYRGYTTMSIITHRGFVCLLFENQLIYEFKWLQKITVDCLKWERYSTPSPTYNYAEVITTTPIAHKRVLPKM